MFTRGPRLLCQTVTSNVTYNVLDKNWFGFTSTQYTKVYMEQGRYPPIVCFTKPTDCSN